MCVSVCMRWGGVYYYYGNSTVDRLIKTISRSYSAWLKQKNGLFGGVKFFKNDDSSEIISSVGQGFKRDNQ